MRDKKKKNEGGSEKGGENSPISPPLDPRLPKAPFLLVENAGIQLAIRKRVPTRALTGPGLTESITYSADYLSVINTIYIDMYI